MCFLCITAKYSLLLGVKYCTLCKFHIREMVGTGEGGGKRAYSGYQYNKIPLISGF